LASVGTTITRFGALALSIAIALLLVGYRPTMKLAGEEALPAMFVGVAVALVASLAGTLPVFWSRHKPPGEAWGAAVGAMGARMAVALGLGCGLALATPLPVKPLLLWVVITHGAMMVPDTMLSIKILAQGALAEDR
jgi:hypothetical protein